MKQTISSMILAENKAVYEGIFFKKSGGFLVRLELKYIIHEACCALFTPMKLVGMVEIRRSK